MAIPDSQRYPKALSCQVYELDLIVYDLDFFFFSIVGSLCLVPDKIIDKMINLGLTYQVCIEINAVYVSLLYN